MGLAGLFGCHIHLVKSFYSLSVVSKSIGSDHVAESPPQPCKLVAIPAASKAFRIVVFMVVTLLLIF
jgi:hypothetical protein